MVEERGGSNGSKKKAEEAKGEYAGKGTRSRKRNEKRGRQVGEKREGGELRGRQRYGRRKRKAYSFKIIVDKNVGRKKEKIMKRERRKKDEPRMEYKTLK